MPVFKLPLSGDVVQPINPITSFFSPAGGQFGLVNITVGQSSAPDVEKDLLSDVGSYGKQIGQVSDALLAVTFARARSYERGSYGNFPRNEQLAQRPTAMKG
jgi:hypothetical protein